MSNMPGGSTPAMAGSASPATAPAADPGMSKDSQMGGARMQMGRDGMQMGGMPMGDDGTDPDPAPKPADPPMAPMGKEDM
jgi:hypothetical protein